ncbi:MAG: bifunctional hydroxymethylpyrimidine kinase/phosphomethylpyrimidine kinase [Proteobacteria bacterium]|nr:bifunctional hydroxymethylpyrimidine kinase/phosphomethylpyrimidine kinase [Pseudomonadota bacterium]
MMARKYHKVLTIAGSDSGGGAGIQADIKTFSALGCYGMSVITSLTAQNTKGITAIHGLPPGFVQAQLEAVLSDLGTDAVKIGMLYSSEVVEMVAVELRKYHARNIVLDPVMAAQSGGKLLEDEALEATKEFLMPISTVVTPNLPEASALLGREINDLEEMKRAARELAAYGSKSVLIKGGHSKDRDATDLLFVGHEDRFVIFRAERIATRNSHGTGCTLSSAIASFLAKGYPLEEAIGSAKEFITGAIKAGAEYEIGTGDGPVHHYYRFWE